MGQSFGEYAWHAPEQPKLSYVMSEGTDIWFHVDNSWGCAIIMLCQKVPTFGFMSITVGVVL